jgi:hypothetical protein
LNCELRIEFAIEVHQPLDEKGLHE